MIWIIDSVERCHLQAQSQLASSRCYAENATKAWQGEMVQHLRVYGIRMMHCHAHMYRASSVRQLASRLLTARMYEVCFLDRRHAMPHILKVEYAKRREEHQASTSFGYHSWQACDKNARHRQRGFTPHSTQQQQAGTVDLQQTSTLCNSTRRT